MGSIDRIQENFAATSRSEETSPPRPYVTPSIRAMDEKEVLSSFQVTVAAITWWVM